MIDQSIIRVSNGPLVRPEAFTDDDFKINDLIPIGSRNTSKKVRIKDGVRLVSHSTSIDILPDKALKIFTRSPDGGAPDPERQRIYEIHLNPSKILRGHNGGTIQSDREVALALTVVRHILAGVVEKPKQATRLIPGLPGRSSYWASIEVAMNLRDPEGAVWAHMQRMRTARIRKNALYFENTVCLKGTGLELKCYDKLAHLKGKNRGRVPDVADNRVTRLEVVLKKDKMIAFDFIPKAERPSIQSFEGKQKLVAFNLDQLKAVHRHYFSDLKAVYHAATKDGDKNNAGFGAVLAAIAQKWDIPVPEMLDVYRQTAHKSESASRAMRGEIDRFMSASSVITAEQLLSDEAYLSQPAVVVEGVTGCEFYARRHNLLSADPDILNCYSPKRTGRKVDPVTTMPWQ
jgi:hypothetical protein